MEFQKFLNAVTHDITNAESPVVVWLERVTASTRKFNRRCIFSNSEM